MDNSTVRSFIAVPLPEPVQGHLETIQRRFRSHPGIRASFPKSAGLHITLFFLGECSGETLDRVKPSMDISMAGIPRLQLQVSGLGVFPGKRRVARILWAGICGEVHVLADIYRRLNENLSGIGFPKAKAKFSPHITIARFKTSPQPQILKGLIAETAMAQEKDLGFHVTGITLFKSTLTAKGAQYNSLHTSPCQA